MLVFAYMLTFLRSFMWAAVVGLVILAVLVVGSCVHPAPAPAAHGGSSSYLMDAQHKLRCTYNDGALAPCWRA